MQCLAIFQAKVEKIIKKGDILKNVIIRQAKQDWRITQMFLPLLSTLLMHMLVRLPIKRQWSNLAHGTRYILVCPAEVQYVSTSRGRSSLYRHPLYTWQCADCAQCAQHHNSGKILNIFSERQHSAKKLSLACFLSRMMLCPCKQCKTPTYVFLAHQAEIHIIHTW